MKRHSHVVRADGTPMCTRLAVTPYWAVVDYANKVLGRSVRMKGWARDSAWGVVDNGGPVIIKATRWDAGSS